MGKGVSAFNERTEESSAMQYFQFYGYLSQQQNMMQDYIRTSTYQRAILGNLSDFKDKVVLDVGAGSGILSFFAIQAGAKKVYAVEASNMANHAELLVAANNLSDKIIVIAGKIEEIELPEQVDCIVSEPMGYMLYNERMLETYLHAKKWLVSGKYLRQRNYDPLYYFLFFTFISFHITFIFISIKSLSCRRKNVSLQRRFAYRAILR
jgi:histone-arginine methyltransferase CARM1